MTDLSETVQMDFVGAALSDGSVIYNLIEEENNMDCRSVGSVLEVLSPYQ